MSKKKRDPNSKIFHVSANHVGQTVAAILRLVEPEFSWTKIRKLVVARHVQINGNLCLDEGRRLKDGDVIKLFLHPLAPPPKAEHVEIIYLDQHLVVVNKPSGITSVRHAKEERKTSRKQNQPTLEDLMPEVLGKRGARSFPAPQRKRSPHRSRAPKTVRPTPRIKVFPVHRLDRETSGLMMFALSTAIEDQMVAMFRNHTIQRTYRAVAIGNVRGMTIESHLARDRGDGLRGSVAESKNTQRAVTHVRPVKGLGDYTLVECRLETGRTHQIRIHLSEKGHMICGEKTYVRSIAGKSTVDRSGAPRLALHAAKLEFMHPISGRKISVEAPMPTDLEQFLNRLDSAKRKSSNTTQRTPDPKK